MSGTYGGTYRGTVVETADPLQQGRLLVTVPEIYGTEPAWALPSHTPGGDQVPAIGDDVWVSFEHGDPAYPVWEAAGPAEGAAPAESGHVGLYRAVVVDADDPMQQGRLQVTVPEVAGDTTMWAAPGPSVGSDAVLPPVGAEVWVEFGHGDPAYPIWVGVK
jgi:hypothetical protein